MDITTPTYQGNPITPPIQQVPTTPPPLPIAQTPPPPSTPVKKTWVWVIIVITTILGISWLVWSRLDFAIVNKPYSQGNLLHVRYLKLSKDGYLLVSNSRGGLPFEQIGYSDVVKKGFYTNISVELFEKGDPLLPNVNIVAGERVFLELYHDTNADYQPNPESDTLIKEITVDL